MQADNTFEKNFKEFIEDKEFIENWAVTYFRN